MSGVETVTVAAGEGGQRLDRWFKRRYPALTHGRLEKLLRTGQIRVDGARAKANVRLEEGQQVRVPPLGDGASPKPAARKPKLRKDDALAIERMILHEDETVLALDKPAGLAVQGGSQTTRHIDGMLESFAIARKLAEKPRLVHRLDKDTSGVLVLAKTRAAAAALSASFQGKKVLKTYWGLVQGVPHPLEGVIDLPLAKEALAPDFERMAPQGKGEGQKAITLFHAVEHLAKRVSWLALRPITGRTHQLRVHCAALGTPIVGDRKYAQPNLDALGPEIEDRLHLHARTIQFYRPGGGRLELSAPLPPHMKKAWDFFSFDADYADDPFAEAEF